MTIGCLQLALRRWQGCRSEDTHQESQAGPAQTPVLGLIPLLPPLPQVVQLLVDECDTALFAPGFGGCISIPAQRHPEALESYSARRYAPADVSAVSSHAQYPTICRPLPS